MNNKKNLDPKNEKIQILVKCDGEDFPSLQVTNCTVRSDINSVPSATLTVVSLAGRTTESSLSIENRIKLESKISIIGCYGSKKETLFSGSVIRQSFKLLEDGLIQTTLKCIDIAIKLRGTRKLDYYIKKTDSEILTSLIINAGMTADVEQSYFVHELLVQPDCTDWDFIKARADFMGKLIQITDGIVRIKTPNLDAEPVLTLTLGDNLLDVEAEVGSHIQYPSSLQKSWHSPCESTYSSNPLASLPNTLGMQTSQEVENLQSRIESQCSDFIEGESYDRQSSISQLKIALMKKRGKVKFQGCTDVKLLDLIKLEGISDQVNGNTLVV